MTSPLENLAGPAKPLLAEPADAAELQGLLRSGSARLADAGNAALSLESRFDVDERLVLDTIVACQRVAAALKLIESRV